MEAEPAAPLIHNFGLVRYGIGASSGSDDPIQVSDTPPPPPPPPAMAEEGIALDFAIVDAEYSRELDRIIALQATPDRLLIVEPNDGTFDVVTLPLPATSVSVHPGGLRAAVGHDGWVSIVELEAQVVLSTQAVSADVVDVVFADNGFVYALPARDQWENVYSLELMTGDETVSTGSIYAGTVARLHPSGDRLYGANRGLSPSDIERYDIGSGTAQISYDSPYHGDYAMCGDLWFSEGGARIFTACGNVFRASNVRQDDMTYNGALQGATSVAYVDHSAAAGLVAAAVRPPSFVPSGTPPELGRVAVFEDEFLQTVANIDLPDLVIDGTGYDSQPRFVFFDASGSTLHVITRSEPPQPAAPRSTLISISVSSL